MAYRVEITARAERDLVSLYFEIDAANSAAAKEWYLGLRDAIVSLAQFPNRNPVTPENKRLWHLLYGTKPHVYRVIFRVKAKPRTVQILHIRHGARRRFK